MATVDLTPETFEGTVGGGMIAANERHPDIMFGKVDAEARQTLAAAAQIGSIPTLMAFRDGILVYARPGAIPARTLEQPVQGVRDLDMDDVCRPTAEQATARSA